MTQVLCVEDNEDANKLMGFLLKKAGRFITPVPSSIEAQILIEKRNYDLYILDGQAETDGLDLCRLIRKLDKDVPVIIYSGYAYDKDRQNGMDAGATMYLVKPDGITVIAEIVEEFLSKKENYLATQL